MLWLWYDRSSIEKLSPDTKDRWKSEVQKWRKTTRKQWLPLGVIANQMWVKTMKHTWPIIYVMAKQVQNNKETNYESLDEVYVSRLSIFQRRMSWCLISFANISNKSAYSNIKIWRKMFSINIKEFSFERN